MAATQLFINVAANSIVSALVRSLTDMTPVPFPELVVGDGRAYELYFVDGRGGYAAFSGDGSYIPYVAIGECGFPSGGTAKWTFSGQQTSPLAYNVSPAALQAALEALSSVGAGNVSVAGVAGKYYLITFQGALGNAAQPEVTVDFSGLTPASTVDVTTITAGSASPATNAVQLAFLAENPLTFADNWTPITNGWTGTLSSRTVEVIEAYAAAGGTLSRTFQATVANADGVRTTYAKVAASIQCTVINPESFAGADKPLLATQAALNAAVLGLNNFTREALTSAAAGNTNVTRPATSSRHHLARVSITGAAGIRTISLLTTNSPNPGDVILLALLADATPGNELKVYNATTGGTLLADITTAADSQPFFLLFSWSGSAWELDLDDSIFLAKTGNLAGLANTVTAKANLKALFANISDKSANFTIAAADEGTLFRVSTAGGAVLVTLPGAGTVSAGFLIAIQKYDAATQNVTTTPATRTLVDAGETVIVQSDGSAWTTVLAYDPTTEPPTLLETVQNRQDITGLTGAAVTDLDSIATAAGATSLGSALWISAGTGGVWVLRAGTDAGSLTIVRPFDFDAITNAVVWELRMRGVPPTLVAGDVLYFNGTNIVRLGIGTAGQVLVVNTGATAPEWAAGGNGYGAVAIASPDDVQTVSPANPIHLAPITIGGTAGANELRIAAPPTTGIPGPGGYKAGYVAKLRVFIPGTVAGITVAVIDDTSSTTLLTFASDDGGGSNFYAYLELYWDGTIWKVQFLFSPTV